MFSSNQVLSVSGELDIQYIKYCLLFALRLANYDYNSPKSTCVWQITEDGRYCIGWASVHIPKGWNAYDFEFDIDKISEIILKHMESVDPYQANNCAACSGFVMDVIPETLAEEYNGIVKPFYGLILFRPYLCEYSK
jgi:hypothetical protein